MADVLMYVPILGATTESGDKLYVYSTGTTTDLECYTDSALTTPHSQPIVADSSGIIAPVYFDGTGDEPKLVLKDSDDVEKWTVDPYTIDDLTTLSATVATNTTDIATNTGDIATLETQVATLETESADYESRITTLEGATTPLTTSDFTGTKQQLSAEGWQELPGGLIIQWGSKTTAGSGTTTITFPKAFTTACYSVTLGAYLSGDTGGISSNVPVLNAAPTTTQAVVSTQGGSVGFYWQAVGK